MTRLARRFDRVFKPVVLAFFSRFRIQNKMINHRWFSYAAAKVIDKSCRIRCKAGERKTSAYPFSFFSAEGREKEKTTLFASVRDSLNKHIIADETRFVKFLRKRAHIGA